VIATDHAPHTKEEKEQVYTKAPSGGPMVQHALPALLKMVQQGKISIEKNSGENEPQSGQKFSKLKKGIYQKKAITQIWCWLIFLRLGPLPKTIFCTNAAGLLLKEPPFTQKLHIPL